MKIDTSGDEGPRMVPESQPPLWDIGPHCRFCGNLIYWVLRRWRTREGQARCSDGRLHDVARLGTV
jgi:hypothetical protein